MIALVRSGPVRFGSVPFVSITASALQSVKMSSDNVAVESEMETAPPYACAIDRSRAYQ